MLTTPADYVVRDLLRGASGDLEARAKTVIADAERSPSLQQSALLRHIRDCVEQGRPQDIIDALSGSAARAHDVGTQGLRAGGFASVHESRLRGPAPDAAETTSRNEPAHLAKYLAFRQAGYLTRAQRDWCVAAASGAETLPPASAALRPAWLLQHAMLGLEDVALNVAIATLKGREPPPEDLALMRCLIANFRDPRTSALIKTIHNEGSLADRAIVLRTMQLLEAMQSGVTRHASLLGGLDAAAGRPGRAARASAISLARAHADVERERGNHEAAAGHLRLAAAFGDSSARRDATLAAATHMIKSGAHEHAAERLAAIDDGPALAAVCDGLWLSRPTLTGSQLRSLDAAGFGELAHALRSQAVPTVEGTWTLVPPEALDVDALIAKGGAFLSSTGRGFDPEELNAAATRARAAQLLHDREKPPSRGAQEELSQARNALARLMPGVLSAITAAGGVSRDQADAAMAGINVTAEAYGVSTGLDITLIKAFQLLGGRGVALIDDVDVWKGAPYADSIAGKIMLSSDGAKPVRGDAFHEVGHAGENSDPAYRLACRRWIQRRAEGKPLIDLKTRGYRSGGVAYDGNFVTVYVGKDYGNRGTEVTSVFFEHASDPAKLADLLMRDEEHFCLVTGWLTSPRKP